jgi:hypothetical protein
MKAAAARSAIAAATEERILAAVGEVLARDGFGALGVNAIAREAGVDKVLIYRYFGGLPELLRLWGASGRFWPTVQRAAGRGPPGRAGAAAGRALRLVLRPLHRRTARAAADTGDPGRRDRGAQ